ncbi:hypothetical protein ACIQY8_16305 [Streptomyces albidoflavus]
MTPHDTTAPARHHRARAAERAPGRAGRDLGAGPRGGPGRRTAAPRRRARTRPGAGPRPRRTPAARTDLPPFDTSATDGWARGGPWALATGGPRAAGRNPAGAPAPGAAAPIATGARLPAGATAFLRREHGATDPRRRRGRSHRPLRRHRPRPHRARRASRRCTARGRPSRPSRIPGGCPAARRGRGTRRPRRPPPPSASSAGPPVHRRVRHVRPAASTHRTDAPGPGSDRARTTTNPVLPRTAVDAERLIP